jgi:hypothetical protein
VGTVKEWENVKYSRVSDGSGALFLRGFFCRTKKSGNGQHDPEGHAQIIDLILIIKEYVTD